MKRALVATLCTILTLFISVNSANLKAQMQDSHKQHQQSHQQALHSHHDTAPSQGEDDHQHLRQQGIQNKILTTRYFD